VTDGAPSIVGPSEAEAETRPSREILLMNKVFGCPS
jgi:hypothetical protein